MAVAWEFSASSAMVQGKTKGLQSKSPSNRQKSANLKKGKKYIAPKKPALVKQAAMHKVMSATLMISTVACPKISDTDVELQNKQVDRSADGICSIVWKADYNEKCSRSVRSSQSSLPLRSH